MEQSGDGGCRVGRGQDERVKGRWRVTESERCVDGSEDDDDDGMDEEKRSHHEIRSGERDGRGSETKDRRPQAKRRERGLGWRCSRQSLDNNMICGSEPLWLLNWNLMKNKLLSLSSLHLIVLFACFQIAVLPWRQKPNKIQYKMRGAEGNRP